MMNILVTGGAGFIGSHIVERLTEERPAARASPAGLIRVVDNLSTGHLENIQPFLEQVEFIRGDLLDDGIRASAVQGIDVILHQAAIPSVPRSVDKPVESHCNNAHVTLLLLDSARRQGVKRFVFAGSSSAYGDSETLPKVETMVPQPLSPYAASKVAGEYYCSVFSRCYGLDTAVLRYFNVFGPRQDPTSQYSGVIAKFCMAYCRNQPITIFGDGSQSRDFTFISNVVEANLLAARSSTKLDGQVFNVGCGERYSLNEMVRVLNELTGKAVTPAYAAERCGDVKHSLADIARARATLGYEPAVRFRQGLSQTLEWYRTTLGEVQ